MERYWHAGGRNSWRGAEVFPRAPGPCIRAAKESTEPTRELVIGQWGLIPCFAKTAKLAYSTINARFEGIEAKASFKSSWQYAATLVCIRQSHYSRHMASGDHLLTLREDLEANDQEVTRYYRLATLTLVVCLIVHLAFSSHFVVTVEQASIEKVYLFAVFNVAALVIELYLSRVAFMLGSRAGQLRDLMFALRIACSDMNAARFEAAVRAIMATRRDAAGLKILDVESIVAKVAGAKPGKEDKA